MSYFIQSMFASRSVGWSVGWLVGWLVSHLKRGFALSSISVSTPWNLQRAYFLLVRILMVASCLYEA
jgi:hypothetical protein